MKKAATLALSGALFCLMATTAFAIHPLSLMVNGQQVDDQPLQMVDGTTYGPVRAIAESLGAKVIWDGARQQVQIQATDTKTLQSQLDQLQRALAPGSPEVAAQTWAKGVKERNGAQQYAVLSSELRNSMKDSFTQNNWVTGVSSPWVDSYQVTHEQRIDPNTYRYDVEFTYATSTGSAGESIQPLLVKRDDDHWFISKLGDPVQETQQTVDQKVTLPDGTSLSAPGDAELSAQVRLRIETLGVAKGDREDVTYASVVGNHSEVKAIETVDLPTGHAKLLTVERTAPAAAQDTTVLYEYWLVILGPNPDSADMLNAYTLSAVYSNQNADAQVVKKQLLDLAKRWMVEQK